MAREKRPPHKPPNSLAIADREIATHQLELVQEKNTYARCKALANSSLPEETPVPVGFSSLAIKEARKSQWQRDLGKAQSIFNRHLNNKKVTYAELDWAKALCAREAEMEQEELEQAHAAEIRTQKRLRNQQRRRQKIMAANRDPVWTARMLSRALLGDGDKSDSGSDSDLSSVASDVSALDPDRVPQEESRKPTETPNHELGDDDDDEENGREAEAENADAAESFKAAEEKEIQPHRPSAIANAIATLKYDDNPSDLPSWIGGPSKPLPHPYLTALQDFEVATRFYYDEIARLKNLRASLPTPDGHPAGGHWIYQHLGSTKEVVKDTGKGKNMTTFTRGWWVYVSGGEEVEMMWDEYPLGFDGQPLGWGTHELENEGTAKALRRIWEPETGDGGVEKEYEETGLREADGADERDAKGGEVVAGIGSDNGEVGEAEDDVAALERMVDEDVWGSVISISDDD